MTVSKQCQGLREIDLGSPPKHSQRWAWASEGSFQPSTLAEKGCELWVWQFSQRSTLAFAIYLSGVHAGFNNIDGEYDVARGWLE